MRVSSCLAILVLVLVTGMAGDARAQSVCRASHMCADTEPQIGDLHKVISRSSASANLETVCEEKISNGCCFDRQTVMQTNPPTVYDQWLCPVSQKRKAAQAVSHPENLGNDEVVYEETDLVFTVDAEWHQDRIDQRFVTLDTAPYQPFDVDPGADPVHVYIIDTGIGAEHPAFSGIQVVLEYPSPSEAGDCDGHGTHVGSLVASATVGVVESSASVVLHSIRVLNCMGSGPLFDVIDGMAHVYNTAPRRSVVNMSLGSSYSQMVNDQVDQLRNRGIAVVVSAGNSNQDACASSPASAPGATTVGSTRLGDARSGFSNYGSCVDIFAPGSDIVGARFGSNGYISLSGTSMASPIAAGAVARTMLRDNIDPEPAILAVINEATQNSVGNIGSGSPNLLIYVGSDVNAPQPPVQPDPVGAFGMRSASDVLFTTCGLVIAILSLAIM